MKKRLLLTLLLLPSLASAYTLQAVQGITLYTLNGEKISSQPVKGYQLIAGKNQIAVRFDGKLSVQGKKEHFQSKPYLLTFAAKSDLKLTTVSKKYKTIVSLEQQGMPIFKADTDSVSIVQKRLPALSKTLPYANIAALVTHYNEKNGLYFDDAGLKKLAATEVKDQQAAKESIVVTQLKYWYSKATKKEIAAFEKWKEAN